MLHRYDTKVLKLGECRYRLARRHRRQRLTPRPRAQRAPWPGEATFGTELGPNEWDGELSDRSSPAPLLQGWGWGEVQAQAGWLVERLKLPGGAPVTVLLRQSGPIRTAYVPRGPAAADAAAIGDLIAWAREQRLVSIRIEPEAPPSFASTLSELGLVPATASQPVKTAIVKLRDPEELLASFDKKTRYSIRKSAEVTVEEGTDVTALAQMAAATSARHGIALPGADYYKLLIDHVPGARTYTASYEGEVLAANLFVLFQKRAYYLYAGTSGARSDLNPAYAALWAAMRGAVDQGCRDMDLWGMPRNEGGNDPLAGVGRFKAGFNPVEVEYCGAWDFVLSAIPHHLAKLADLSRNQLRKLRKRGLLPHVWFSSGLGQTRA